MTHRSFHVAAGLLVVGLAAGGLRAQMGGHDHAHDHGAAHAKLFQGVTRGVAVLIPTQGSSVRGTITFEEAGDGVKVTANVTGLEPNSKHGFHIHEFGDATSPDGTSAGGHYNPEGHEHGLPDEPAGSRHAGDLGNLETDGSGRATYEETIEGVTIAGMVNPILGRGVVVHEKADDGGQPTGNAGGRLAVGVIGVGQPAKQ